MIKRFLICLSLILGGCYVEVRPYPPTYPTIPDTVVVLPDGMMLYKITFYRGPVDYITAYSYDGAMSIAKTKWPDRVIIRVEVVLTGR